MDWHRTGASQQVSVRDATTRTKLDTRTIEAEVVNSMLVSPSTDLTLSDEVTGAFFRTVNTQ